MNLHKRIERAQQKLPPRPAVVERPWDMRRLSVQERRRFLELGRDKKVRTDAENIELASLFISAFTLKNGVDFQAVLSAVLPSISSGCLSQPGGSTVWNLIAQFVEDETT